MTRSSSTTRRLPPHIVDIEASLSRLTLVWDRYSDKAAPDVIEPGEPAYLIAFHRGCKLGSAEQEEMALAAFREAIALKPDFVLGYCKIGHALYNLYVSHGALTLNDAR